MLAPVVENKIEVPIGLINSHPGEELLLAGCIIIDANGVTPCSATICRFSKEDIGIITAVALIRPVDIDGAPIRARYKSCLLYTSRCV